MICYEKLVILGHTISSKNLVFIVHVFIILLLDRESEDYIETKMLSLISRKLIVWTNGIIKWIRIFICEIQFFNHTSISLQVDISNYAVWQRMQWCETITRRLCEIWFLEISVLSCLVTEWMDNLTDRLTDWMPYLTETVQCNLLTSSRSFTT